MADSDRFATSLPRRVGPRLPNAWIRDNRWRTFAPWLLLALAIAIYYWQVLLQGKLVDGSDLVYARYAPWLQAPPAGYVPSNLALNDSVVSLAPAMTFVRHSLWSGQLPLWNPYTEFGMPFFAQSQWGLLSPAQWPYLAIPGHFTVYTAETVVGITKIAFATSGTYLLARRLKMSPVAGIFAAIAFSFGGYMTAWLGMPASAVVAFLPWSCWGLELVICSDRYLLGIAALSTSVASLVLGGHPEVILYAVYGVVLYGAVRFLQEFRALRGERVRRLLGIAAAAVLALGLAAIVLVPAAELFIRSVDITQRGVGAYGSTGWRSLIYTVDPNHDGNPIHGQTVFGVGYAILVAPFNAGLAPLGLSLLALLFRDRRVVPFLVIFAAAILIGVDAGPYLSIAKHVPALRSANNVHGLLLWSFALALAGGIGLDRLGTFVRERVGWRPVGIAVTTLLAVWLFIDLYHWGHNYNPRVNRGVVGVPQPAEMANVGHGGGATRTGFLGEWAPPALLPMLFRVPEARGYGQPTRKDYDTYMQVAVSQFPERYTSYIGYSITNDKPGIFNAFNAANVGYLAYTTYKPDEAKLADAFKGRRLIQPGPLTVLQNPHALTRAYVVSDYVVQPNQRRAVQQLAAPGFDPRRSVVLDKRPQVAPRSGPPPGPPPTITSYRNGGVKIDAHLSRPGFLVLSDSIYPGWSAKVDGKPVHLYRANGLFRAVEVPRGDHKVTFSFRPASVFWGGIVTLLSLVALALLVFLGRRAELAHATRPR
jgi:hypothetical protein